MAIDHTVEPAPVGSAGSVLRVRCTDEQAHALSGILARLYPGRRYSLLPIMHPDYSHSCLVNDTPLGLERKWPSIEVQMLLGGMPRKRNAWQPLTAGARAEAPMQDAPGRAPHAVGVKDIIGSGVHPGVRESDRGPGATSPAARPPSLSLDQIAMLPPAERRRALQKRYDPRAPSTLEAGVLLAQTLVDLQAHGEAASLCETLCAQATGTALTDARVVWMQSLFALGRLDAVIQHIAPDEQNRRLRALRGIALDLAGDGDAALKDLLYSWQAPAARTKELALALARALWRSGRYHEAAHPYRVVLECSPVDLEETEYTSDDFAAIVELARCGEYHELGDDRLLDCIFAYCTRASAKERSTDDSHQSVLQALDLARQLGQPRRLLHAYRLAMDDLLQRRQGPRLVELMEHAAVDERRGLLSPSDRFNLLDELSDHLMDYRQLLRQPLLDGYEELLRAALARAAKADDQLTDEARDIYRALYDLDRRNSLCDQYRRHVLARNAGITETVGDRSAPIRALAGKRIAIVGGHESTRLRVRERLQAWGVRVDEVPPPVSGRMSEREVADRVRLSDLVLLVVTYMGHDMSTIVNNLVARKALAGQVLAIECRGASGVIRTILEWAEATIKAPSSLVD